MERREEQQQEAPPLFIPLPNFGARIAFGILPSSVPSPPTEFKAAEWSGKFANSPWLEEKQTRRFLAANPIEKVHSTVNHCSTELR